jgi:DNA-binding transcriptional ArsR family regulator
MLGMKEHGDEAQEPLAQALKALAHPKRLRLLRFLVEPHSLEQIAGELGVARQSAQEHVDQLLATGAIEARRGRGDHGPVTEYVVVLPRLFDLHEQLGQRFGVLSAEFGEELLATFRTQQLDQPGPRATSAAPRLIVVYGMRVGRTIPLEGQGPWLIGRDPHAALCIDYDPYVSSRHCEVRRGAKGFELQDALSSNGTQLDWSTLPRGGAMPLQNGQLIRVGKSLVLFRSA